MNEIKELFLREVWWWGSPDFVVELYRSGKRKARNTGLIWARVMGIMLIIQMLAAVGLFLFSIWGGPR